MKRKTVFTTAFAAAALAASFLISTTAEAKTPPPRKYGASRVLPFNAVPDAGVDGIRKPCVLLYAN